MGKIAGIDLGTTFSAISILNDNGKPEIVKNFEGGYLTPSVVGFPSDREGTSLVGEEAIQLLEIEPNRVIKEVKRDMGDNDKEYHIAGKEFTPVGISSLILKKLVQDAEKQYVTLDTVVVTVPANFAESARQATKKAVVEAGINFQNVIDEPTAAALHYAFSNTLAGKIMIYDFGGGTFDITIADVSGKDIECKTSQGDQHLGGTDIDRIILEKMKDAYKKEKNVDLINDQNERNEIHYMFQAEKIKKNLTKKETHKEPIKGNEGGIIVEFTRSDFESSVAALMSKIDALIDGALFELKIKEKDITDVLLVGGSTRLPIVSNNIRKRFNKDPLTGVNVDEAVALGAALYAGKKTDKEKLTPTQAVELNKINLKQVSNQWFGTTIQEFDEDKNEWKRVNATMIAKNTPLPCSKTQTYYTPQENQTSLPCTVNQSLAESKDLDFVEKIWEGELGNLPPGRPAQQPIDVTYSYDENSMMKCSFKDTESGKESIADLTIDSESEPEGTAASSFTID